MVDYLPEIQEEWSSQSAKFAIAVLYAALWCYLTALLSHAGALAVGLPSNVIFKTVQLDGYRKCWGAFRQF